MEIIFIVIVIDFLLFFLLGIIILFIELFIKNKWILVYENDFKNFKNVIW